MEEKLRESFNAVLPITAIVLILSIVVTPMETGTILMFLAGVTFLVVGMSFFQLGAEMAMMPMGEGLGVQLSKSKKLSVIVIVTFFMGIIITAAEPDLQVLANQVPAIPNAVLIWTVAIGVGIMLVFAFLRIIFRINLSHLLIGFYAIVFILSIFVPNEFLAIAFDSGGVTTGPITVPFIMALGLGIASVRSDKGAASDSFGLISISSIGPILAVLLLGIFFNSSDASYSKIVVPEVITTRDVVLTFFHEIPHYVEEVSIAILPLVAVFIILQLTTKRFHKKEIKKISVGFFYTYIGLIIFLTGVNVGFVPVGHLLGSEIALSKYWWLLIPIGMLIGYFIVTTEPAVQILNKQVEDVSVGAISHVTMNKALSLGVAVSVGISMIRVITGISIYFFLVPGYLIAIILTFFVPKIFVGIAFDSGGVASGPMTSTFLLPFTMGACEALGGNVMTDAFGVVAMVAMTPLIAIQVVGLVSARKAKSKAQENIENDSDEITDF